MQKFIEFFKRLFDVKVEQKIDAKNTRDATFNQTANIFNFLVPSIILAVGLVALGIWGLREYRNSKYNLAPMSGNINVAVVRFSDFTNNQCNIGKDVGLLIANTFYTRLENDGLRDDFYNTTDKILLVRPPVELSELKGGNEARLAESAEKLALEINAHIVVYGTITCNKITKQAYFQVVFYISPSNFSDAEEIVGEFSFGANALYGNVSSGEDFEDINQELQQKVTATSLLIKAISTFQGENYADSLEYLEQAKSSTLWVSGNGQEVIYIIEGNAESKLAHGLNISGSEKEALVEIEKARDSYNKANDITKADPQKGKYARSYMGLAGVENFYLTRKSNITGNLGDLDLAALAQMRKMLKAAETAEYNPPTADIFFKESFYNANTNLLLYKMKEAEYIKNNDKSLLIEAKENFNNVISEYKGSFFKEGNIRIRELAARSYSGLALVERFYGNESNAIQYLDLAVATSQVPSLKLFYLIKLAEAHERNRDFERALEIYRLVLDQKTTLTKQLTESYIQDLEAKAQALEAKILSTP